MKKVLFGAIAAVAMITSATAADIVPAPAPQVYAKSPVVAPLPIWTGFYLGAMGGYATENNNNNGANTGTISGGFAGGTLGYNWQAGQVVFGIEGDAAWTNIGATVGNPAFVALTDRIRDFGTARARIGWAFDSVLLYATGGYAWIDNRFTVTVLGVNFADTQFHSGWTAGGGVEVMFAPKWSIKAEYLYRSFQSKNYFVAIVPPGIPSGNLNLHSVQAGINFHF
jgi:outer membrane immunogenic protein